MTKRNTDIALFTLFIFLTGFNFGLLVSGITQKQAAPLHEFDDQAQSLHLASPAN